MANYFYDLPYELQLLCYQYSNQFVIANFRKKNHAAFIIQSYWFSFLNPPILPNRQNATLFIIN